MDDPVVLKSIYRMTAVNFRLSAEVLFKNMELKIDGTPAKYTAIPFYFLTSHSVELFLKAALLKEGVSEKELRNYSYRHNLLALLGRIQSFGLLITPETVSLIEVLSEQHKTHALRYTALLNDGESFYMPRPSLIFKMLDELLLLTHSSAKRVQGSLLDEKSI